MKKYFKNKYENKNNIVIITILFLLMIFGLIFLLLIFILYIKIITPLSDVSNLKNIKIPETSIIYDKNGGELYKIYSENRTYIKYDYINKNMINAIVASEDKRFWTNPGYDTIGIFRAIINGLKNNNHFSGTSGITQQLAKITYLSNEKTLTRKLKELYLAIKLTNNFSKKDILEIYLNKVFFGGNSYGVEQAAKTFFGKNAADLGVLEASILASLPKAPTSLSPYNKKEFLLGYLLITDKKNLLDTYKVLNTKLLDGNKNIIKHFSELILNLDIVKIGNKIKICNINKNNIQLDIFKIDKKSCTVFHNSKLMTFLNSLYFENLIYKIEYKTGRKDYVLGRMFEDNYITAKEYKQAIVSSFGFEFNKYKDNIRYPYFVMYVKDYLVKKYGEDILKAGGLRIYTSIDPKMQDKAQEILEKQVEINTKKYGAKNAALIAIDNKTGQILSFIGGVDYFDKKNLGNNNMLLSRLQPGSSFKPFIYVLAMMKNSFWKGTILNDVKTTFPGGYTPHNSDGKYMGKMTLNKALNYSRNIPAIKLYYAAGKEDEIIKFLDKFGLKSLLKFKEEYKKKYSINYTYSAPMALGTVQITPLELAEAYSVFANNGYKNNINPIIKIVDSKGNILEQFDESLLRPEKIIDTKWSSVINSMLSDSRQRPKTWNYFLEIPGLKMAAKTGTSTKQYLDKKWTKDSKGKWYKKELIIPRNMWTVGYTSKITTVVWAGNTSGKELSPKAYGINGAGPIMRDFMKFAHKGLEIEDWIK